MRPFPGYSTHKPHLLKKKQQVQKDHLYKRAYFLGTLFRSRLSALSCPGVVLTEMASVQAEHRLQRSPAGKAKATFKDVVCAGAPHKVRVAECDGMTNVKKLCG